MSDAYDDAEADFYTALGREEIDMDGNPTHLPQDTLTKNDAEWLRSIATHCDDADEVEGVDQRVLWREDMANLKRIADLLDATVQSEDRLCKALDTIETIAANDKCGCPEMGAIIAECQMAEQDTGRTLQANDEVIDTLHHFQPSRQRSELWNYYLAILRKFGGEPLPEREHKNLWA